MLQKGNGKIVIDTFNNFGVLSYCEGLVFDVVQRNCVVDAGYGLVVQTILVFHCCSHFGDVVFDSSCQCKFFGRLSQAQASIGVQ